MDIEYKGEFDNATYKEARKIWEKYGTGLLSNAVAYHGDFMRDMSEWNDLYQGTKEIATKNSKSNFISNRKNTAKRPKDADNVVNISYQIIESQIDTTIPMPRVDAYEEKQVGKAKIPEGQLTELAQSAEMKIINSENERICKKNSMAYFKVSYDANFSRHSSLGKIVIDNPHPMNVIPQPNVYDIDAMDYIYHIENRTIDDIVREFGEKYRKPLENEGEQWSNVDNFFLDMDNVKESGNTTDKVSLVECWYKDNDGDICLITFVNDIILRFEPTIFIKDDLVSVDSDNKPIKREDTDEPVEEYLREEILVEEVEEEFEEGVEVQIPIKAETVYVEPHIIRRFPFIPWYNVREEKNFRGISDIYIIKDQQEAIKKILSIQQEKLIKGTTKIFVRKNSNILKQVTDAVGQIIETDNPLQDINVVDLKTQDNAYLTFYNLMQSAAQTSTGVSEIYTGNIGNTELSGAAIDKLSSNTSQRLQPKRLEKEIAYIQLYNLVYEFMIAFYDDKIPYRYEGDTGKKYGYFDKSKMMSKDITGQYYYPDMYITVDSGVSKDRPFILQFIQQAGDRLDNIDYWTLAEKSGIPGASEVKQRLIEDKKKMLQQQPEIQNSDILNKLQGGELNNEGNGQI